LISQSTTYWNNLSSLQQAEAQISTTAESIKQAQLKVDAAKIELEAAEESLADYILLAPYDGIVLDTGFRVGEEASGSGTVSIISNEFIVKVTISENDISKISEGNEATVILDAYSDLEFKGVVAEIIPISTDDGGIISFEVLIEFETAEDITLYYRNDNENDGQQLKNFREGQGEENSGLDIDIYKPRLDLKNITMIF